MGDRWKSKLILTKTGKKDFPAILQRLERPVIMKVVRVVIQGIESK